MAEKEQDKPMTFLQRLAHIQNVLKAPKGRYNKFGEYYYRSLEDICEGVKPLLEEYHMLLTIEDDIVLVGDRYYFKATATIIDTDNPALSISNTAYAREALEKKKSDVAQVSGAASSYARKYALNGLFLIDDTKDPDTDEYTRQNGGADTQAKNRTASGQKADTGAVNADNEPITAEEAKTLDNMLKPNQKNFVLGHCGVDSLSKLSKKQYVEVINGLKKNAEAKGQN